MLRELNLYPQWKLRVPPAPKSDTAKPDGVAAEAPRSSASSASAPALPAMPPNHTSPLASRPGYAGGMLSDLAWPELKQTVRDCTACGLRAGCTQTVFGVGDEKADWLFVGEGPGADEDVQGEPFVGQAGKLLDNMLMAIKLKRGDNVYIANVVKCRPPGNRNPEAGEIATCLPYLQRQIELIQPRMIVALGKVASNALLGRDATLASLRGKVHEYRVVPAAGSDRTRVGDTGNQPSIPLIVTYHPAYLLRSPTEKAKAWQDLLMAVRVRHGEA